MTAIDVIIPTYNNLSELKQCVQGFKNQSFDDFRLIFCVDSSNDGTFEYLEHIDVPFDYEILFHKNRRHSGRSATRNLALSVLNAPYCVMIDSDIVPAGDLLDKHYQLLNQRDCISLGEVTYTNRSENFWADYIQSRGKNKFKNMDCLPPQYVTTGNMAMKSRYFKDIGGLDVNMVHYGGEDTELAYRLHQTYHVPIIYNKHCVGYSLMKKSLLSALDQMREFGAINLPYIRKKHPEFNRLFRMDRLESDIFIHRFIRLFFIRRLCDVCIKWVPRTIGPIRRLIIHFLVVSTIYQGYKSIKINRETIL